MSLSPRFLAQLVGNDAALRHHFGEVTTLRDAILELLDLQPGLIHMRRGCKAQSVFGVRLRSTLPPATTDADSTVPQ